MFKVSLAAALALTALAPLAASAGGLAPEVMEAPVVVVADDVTGFAPSIGVVPAIGAGLAAIALIALVSNNDDNGTSASATSGTIDN